MDIESQFLRTVLEYRLLRKGDSVLAALSGGPDSVALLYLLYGLKDKFGLELAAAHLDHGIRAASAQDREFCRDMCRRLKIKFYSRRVNVAGLAKKEKTNIEETGRKARYDYFESVCARYGYIKIATGHTMDDNAETVLFSLVRGSGSRGLAGIRRKRGKIIRPLIEFRKSEIVNWLKSNKINYRIDPTNRSVKFARNRIRTRILPELAKINPRVAESIFRFSRIISEDIELIEKAGVLIYEKALLYDGKSKIVLDLRILSGYDKNLVKMAIAEAFYRLTGTRKSLSFKLLSRVNETIKGKSGARSPLGRGVWIEKSQNRVSLFKTALDSKIVRQFPLVVPGITKVEDSDLKLKSRVLKKGDVRSLKTQPSVALLDYNKIKKPTVRFWKTGDRMRPLGMKGRKLLSDLFIDRKIPTFERKRVPLVVSEGRIAWIAGVAIADDYKVEPSTEGILKIELCAP
jgi:tRNA(Ile)-lysidine synthase